MNFAQWYLKQSIRDQITTGFTMLFFLFSYLSIAIYCLFSYGILNKSMELQFLYIESSDIAKMESHISFLNNQLLLNEEMSKLSIQILRQYIENIPSSGDKSGIFDDNYIKDHFIKSGTLPLPTDCTKPYMCLYYSTSTINPENNADFQKIQENILHVLPMIQAIEETELPWFVPKDNTVNKLVSSLSFYFNDLDMIISISNQLNQKAFYENKISFFKDSYNTFINYLNDEDSNHLVNAYYKKKIGIKDDIEMISVKQPALISGQEIISVKIDKSNKTHNIIHGNTIKDMIEFVSLNMLRSFKGYIGIGTFYNQKSQQELVITISSCLYLLTLQHISEAETIDMTEKASIDQLYSNLPQLPNGNKIFTIDNCFIDKQAKNDILQMNYKPINQSNPEKEQHSSFYIMNNYYQKYRLTLGEYHFKSSKNSQKNIYQVIKSSYPDPNSLLVFQSSFIQYVRYYFYSFYPTMYSMTIYDAINFRILNLILFTLITQITIWRAIQSILYWFIKKISNDVTDPIDQLKYSVENMSFSEKDDLVFKDDDDINDLFITCKEIIKGGLVMQHKNKYDHKDKKSTMRDMASNVIINQAKIDENPSKNTILNCTSELIKPAFKYKEQQTINAKMDNDKPATHKVAKSDPIKDSFKKLTESICKMKKYDDNILYKCYQLTKVSRENITKKQMDDAASTHSGIIGNGNNEMKHPTEKTSKHNIVTLLKK